MIGGVEELGAISHSHGNAMLAAVVGEDEDSLVQALDAEVLLSDRFVVAWRGRLCPCISDDLFEAVVDHLQIGWHESL